jgi:tetratricopeptide (TPR) repeat protein
VKLGKLDQVLLQYPGCAAPCADALWGLGRAAESVRTYPLISANRVSTLGMQREMLERLGSTPLALAALLTWGMGRPDSTLAVLDHGDPRGDLQYHIACSQALQALGRTTEIIQRYGALVGMEGSCTEALIALGRTDEALARYSHTPYLHALALIAAGEYDSVLQRCAQEGAVLPRVLWQAGRFEHMLKTYSERPDLCARVLLAQGRYAEVLARYQDQREQCAKALYCLGRYAEVIGRYPEQREICCLALLKQGGEAHAMKDYPESRYAYANYLLDQGRFAAVVDSFADQVAPYSMALLRLGRPAEIPVDHGLIRLPASTAYDVQTVAALMHLAAGRRAIADSLLRSRRWLDYYSWGGQRFSGFLLGPVLKGLAGDTLAMKTACAATMREHRREFGQRLWYEAAYLSGAVSDSQFLAQPYGWMAAQRLALYRAILCDVRGQRGGALAGYRSVADDVRCQRPGLFLLEDAATLRDIFESGALWEFVTWRILTLGPIELGS